MEQKIYSPQRDLQRCSQEPTGVCALRACSRSVVMPHLPDCTIASGEDVRLAGEDGKIECISTMRAKFAGTDFPLTFL